MDAGTPDVFVKLSLEAGRETIGPAHLDFSVARGLLSVEGTLQALEGNVRLVASARPFDPVPQFVL